MFFFLVTVGQPSLATTLTFWYLFMLVYYLLSNCSHLMCIRVTWKTHKYIDRWAKEFAFLTSSQVALLLLVQGPHLVKHCLWESDESYEKLHIHITFCMQFQGVCGCPLTNTFCSVFLSKDVENNDLPTRSANRWDTCTRRHLKTTRNCLVLESQFCPMACPLCSLTCFFTSV